jgi:hypothetical protein
MQSKMACGVQEASSKTMEFSLNCFIDFTATRDQS